MIDLRPTVVFADDSVPMLEAACSILRPKYNVVKLVTNGQEAVRWVMELSPDLAVFDICMPDMDGFAAARLLNQAGSRTRVLFLTEIEDEDYIQEARLISYGYVLKRRLASDLVAALASATTGLFFLSR